MYCFLLQIFMFQLSSALTTGLHTNPASTTNVSLDTFEASEVHCAPRYMFLIHCIETSGVVGHLPPTLWKVGGGWGHILLFMTKMLLVTEFSALKQKKC